MTRSRLCRGFLSSHRWGLVNRGQLKSPKSPDRQSQCLSCLDQIRSKASHCVPVWTFRTINLLRDLKSNTMIHWTHCCTNSARIQNRVELGNTILEVEALTLIAFYVLLCRLLRKCTKCKSVDNAPIKTLSTDR
jgi:hypothetical protein